MYGITKSSNELGVTLVEDGVMGTNLPMQLGGTLMYLPL